MTRRTQTVIYDVTTEPSEAAEFGGEVVGSGIARVRLAGVGVEAMPRTFRQWAFTLARSSTGRYPTGATKTVRQHLRGGTLVREWAAIELAYSAPTGTTVRARLFDGTNALYWTGAVWAVAGSTNWNTPAAVEANFPALDPAAASSVTVEWELSTTDRTVTPVVYGAAIAARLVFGARTGDTAAETGSDGWLDDLLHRVLIPWLKANAQPERTDEAPGDLTAETAVLEFSDLAGTSYVVSGVQAVYNLDADPRMRSPLTGTWDGSAKTFTLSTPLAIGARWAARVTYAPEVAYAADTHLVIAAYPHIVVETIGPVTRGGGTGTAIVRNAARTSAIAVDSPRHIEFTAQVLCQAEGPVPAFELVEAIDRALDGGEGLRLVSAQTGMPVGIVRDSQERPQRPDAARFGLTVRSSHYRGVESTLPLIQSTDDVLITIGDDALVTADA